jgi:hypothetical protein
MRGTTHPIPRGGQLLPIRAVCGAVDERSVSRRRAATRPDVSGIISKGGHPNRQPRPGHLGSSGRARGEERERDGDDDHGRDPDDRPNRVTIQGPQPRTLRNRKHPPRPQERHCLLRVRGLQASSSSNYTDDQRTLLHSRNETCGAQKSPVWCSSRKTRGGEIVLSG